MSEFECTITVCDFTVVFFGHYARFHRCGLSLHNFTLISDTDIGLHKLWVSGMKAVIHKKL